MAAYIAMSIGLFPSTKALGETLDHTFLFFMLLVAMSAMPCMCATVEIMFNTTL